MYFSRLKRSFINYPDAKFIDFMNGVIQGCTDNPGLPNIASPLANFKTSFDKYVASIPPRNLRNTVNTAIKNENRAEANLEGILLAAFVEYDSRLNEAIMKSSNFDTVDKPQAKGLVGFPKNVSLASNGINQMMMVSCDADQNATLYNVRVSTDEVNWQWFGANNSRTVKVMDLPNNVKLFVQMRLENAHGYSPWSNSVTGVIGVPDVVMSIHN